MKSQAPVQGVSSASGIGLNCVVAADKERKGKEKNIIPKETS